MEELFTIIEVEYEGYRETKIQRAIMSSSVYKKYEKEINSTLDKMFESDMDGEYAHVQGVSYAEIVDYDEALDFFKDERFGWAHEIQEAMLYNVNKEVSDDIEKTLQKFKSITNEEVSKKEQLQKEINANERYYLQNKKEIDNKYVSQKTT